MNIIELQNLVFYYGDKLEPNSFILSVDHWVIEKGSFISIIGPNGCGKSTLLKLLAGIIQPNKGSFYINEKDSINYKRNDLSKIVAYVPQKVGMTFPFSVHEIVMMGRTPYMNLMGFDKNEDRLIVEKALETFELNEIKGKGINEISGGELQRVLIARAVAQKPQILLLDEPNSHLDLKHQIAIFEILTNLSQLENLTVVTVSHDLNLVGLYSNDVVFMKNGRMEISGAKKEIFNEKNIFDVFKVKAEVKYSQTSGNAANVLIKPLSN